MVLGLGNTDKAVHDAPDGTKQTDERGNRADGRQITVAAPHVTTHRRHATLQSKTGTLFNAFVIFRTCGQLQLVLRFVDQLGSQAFRLERVSDIAGLVERACFGNQLLFTLEATLAGQDLCAFAEKR
ncbi:Uncharacterised protein [Klebsiella grimontii]|uniref:Uncharacterized protein n=1 Tax=Klebsiella grimontii TaxID=2058152 RepID=A0A7H4NWK9_9ENTR|nr:Uncharacterised protein [Klebsiella grimontii]